MRKQSILGYVENMLNQSKVATTIFDIVFDEITF